MKSETASLPLDQTRRVSYAEYALIAVILIVATKFCTLPSVLSGVAESKAVWVILLLLVLEYVILFFATKTAKCGGLPLLEIKRGIKVPLLFLFALFFALKLAAFSREISTYYALSLFENAPVLPITVLLLIACALLAKKGFMGIGRVTEIFVWLFLFVFLFVLIFTRTEGDLFNALAIFNPDFTGMGKGVWQGLAWFGDSAVVAFLDLRGEDVLAPQLSGAFDPQRSKAKRRIILAVLLVTFFLSALFYAVFIAVYGDAAKMTDYAFIKLSAFKANTDELGSADWPVIILWAILSALYLSLLFLGGKECLSGIAPSKEDQKQKTVPSFCLSAAVALTISFLFLDEEGDYESFMTRVMNVVTLLAAAATIGVGIYALCRLKGGRDEEQD